MSVSALSDDIVERIANECVAYSSDVNIVLLIRNNTAIHCKNISFKNKLCSIDKTKYTIQYTTNYSSQNYNLCASTQTKHNQIWHYRNSDNITQVHQFKSYIIYR